MKQLNEDYTAGVLAGVPLFCVNRLYSYPGPDQIAKHRYIFEFDNSYGASVVEFYDRRFSSGHRYELALLFNGGITDDICRGDEKYIMELLDRIERTGDILRAPNLLSV